MAIQKAGKDLRVRAWLFPTARWGTIPAVGYRETGMKKDEGPCRMERVAGT